MNDIKKFKENFLQAYKELYSLHPQQTDDIFHLRYLHVDWFFPNHLHCVLEKIVQLWKKYYPEANIEVALFGGLLHDGGLVYKRNNPDPDGHENRSIEYTISILNKLGYPEEFIDLVCECIRATDISHKSFLPEAILVRNADAYSHMMSIHFFAKANFTKDIHSFVPWFEKKIESCLNKLTITDLKKKVQPAYDMYKSMIQKYKNNIQSKNDILSLFESIE